jgi:uncharacterized surface protein with fasciclin (FAS1) repeats
MPGGAPAPQHENLARIFPTKAIRIVTLAPSLSEGKSSPTFDSKNPEASNSSTSNQSDPPVEEIWRSQAGLLQLVSMLGDEFGGEDDDEDHEVRVFVPDLQDDDIDDQWENLEEWENLQEDDETA